MDFVVRLLREKVISEFDFKRDGLQRTLNSSEASACWGKGALLLPAGQVGARAERYHCSLRFPNSLPSSSNKPNMLWVMQWAFERTVHLEPECLFF